MADDVLDEIMTQLLRVAPKLGKKRSREIVATLRRDIGRRRPRYGRVEAAAIGEPRR